MNKNPSLILSKWLGVLGHNQYNVTQSMQDRFHTLIDDSFNLVDKVNLFSKDEQKVIESVINRESNYFQVNFDEFELQVEFLDNQRYLKRFLKYMEKLSSEK